VSRGKENTKLINLPRKTDVAVCASVKVDQKNLAQYLNLTKFGESVKQSATQLIVVLLDTQGRVNQINKHGCAVLGYEESEVIGKNWFDHFIPIRIREEVKSVFNRLMAGEIVPVEFFENPILTKQGEERIILWHNTVVTDENGAIVGTLSSGEDVTEKRRTEKAIRHSQQLLEKTLNSLDEAVFIIDAETTSIIDCNRAATEIFGYSRDEMIGKTTTFLHIDENALKDFRHHLYEAIAKTGCLRDFEFRMKRKNGEVFPTEHSVMPILDDTDKRIAWVSVVRDITERKRIEQALRRMNEELEARVKAKTEELVQAYNQLKATEEQFYQAQKLESMGILASGIAHDFNNFLTTIKGNISLLKMIVEKESVVEPTRFGQISELINQVADVAERAKDLTQQLLTFAKDKKLSKQKISIRKIINDSVRIALGGAKVNHMLFIPDGIWDVEVDEGQIVQVLNNLLINAREAMPEGGTIEITCDNVEIKMTRVGSSPRVVGQPFRVASPFLVARLKPCPTIGDSKGQSPFVRKSRLPLAPGRYVKIAVKDTGIGIAKENLSHIFEPLWTTKPNGTGLGLACAYSIVKKHNGIITVKSKEGKGTVFTIYLPAVVSIPPLVTENLETTPSVQSDLSAPVRQRRVAGVTRRILIMDDDKEILKTCESILNYFGYEVECAEDGKEALAKYKSAKSTKPFDLVIMDLTIKGGMGGKETISELIKLDPQVKAIVSSGYTNEPIMANYEQYGFVARICKPYEAEELVRTIEEVLASPSPARTTRNGKGIPPFVN